MTPYKTVVIFVFFALLGLAIIPEFSIDLQPSFKLPTLTVDFSLSDSTPETVEQQATSPLENALSQLTEIEKIYSVSEYNHGTIEISFDRRADIDFKKFEVASLIRQLYPKLNPKITYPQVEQRNREAAQRKVLLLYRINAKLAPYQIKKTVGDLFTTQLAQLQGVKEVQITGAEEIQLAIDYYPQKLSHYHIETNNIFKQISESFETSFPGVWKSAGGQQLGINVSNPFTDPNQLNQLQIQTDSNYVALEKLADIYLEEAAPKQFFRINGSNSIALSIYADDRINRAVLATRVKEKIAALSPYLPSGFLIQMGYDDTEFLTKEINKNYLRSGLAIIILLLFILLSYRSWKHLAILATAVIINLGITSLAAYILKVSIHLYTIAGLTISFGMIVDNAIIMLDQLSTKNNRLIFKAIMGATLTTILALLMIFLLPIEERQNLSDFSVIVALSLAGSILVATFYIPAIYNLLFSNSTALKKKYSIGRLRKLVQVFKYYFLSLSFLTRYKKTLALFLILSFGIPVFMLPAKWEDHAWYNQTIGSDFYQEQIRPATDKLLGGSLRLFVRNVYERSGYRDPEKTRLYINASLPYGNTLSEMDHVMHGMEKYLQTVAGIDSYITQVYSGQQAIITISFKEQYENGALPYQLKGRLIAQSLDWGGVEWNIYGVGRGFSNSSGESLPNFKVELKGYNYDELEIQAKLYADELLKHKRIQKVNTNERLSWNEKSADQFVLHLSASSLASFSISPTQIAAELNEKTENSTPALMLSYNKKPLPVIIRPANGENFSTYDVLNQYLNTDDKTYNLMGQGTLTKERSTNAIHKENRQYIRQLGFDYYGSFQFGDKYLSEVLTKLKPSLPSGYSVKKVSWSFSWSKTKRQYGLLMVLIAGIYVLSSILFENFKMPLYIIFTIPISFIGLFLSFSLFDFYFDQGGYAAFVLLGGLVVNAAIFIINDLHQLKTPNNRFIAKTVTTKMKPIMLTVISTCSGLLPFLIGGQNEIFWYALAVGTMGGLIFSLISVFVVLPIYSFKN